jgi:hypothetical protein
LGPGAIPNRANTENTTPHQAVDFHITPIKFYNQQQIYSTSDRETEQAQTPRAASLQNISNEWNDGRD